jgi:hypothetical protein
VAFVHALALKSGADWRDYCRGKRADLPTKPEDIPRDPAYVYGDEFRQWGGWGAWLGTANRKGGWRSYDDAVAFVHALGLKNQADWCAYCHGKLADLPTKPADIPAAPRHSYGEEFQERGGMGAWLGTGSRWGGRKKRPWRPYDDAVAFVHALVLKKRLDWAAYCRGERRDLPLKPIDIPADPPSAYGTEFGDRGGWGAWLGTGRR